MQLLKTIIRLCFDCLVFGFKDLEGLVFDIFLSKLRKQGVFLQVLIILMMVGNPLNALPQTSSNEYKTIRIHTIADSLYTKGDNLAALDTLLSALPVFNSINNDSLESKVLSLFGHLQKNLGNDTMGLRNYMIQLSDQQLKNYLISVNAMAEYFKKRHNLPKALSYYKKATIFAKSTNNQMALAHAQMQLGIVFKEMANPEKSKFYLNEAKRIFQKNNHIEGLTIIYNQLGIIAIEQNMEDSAMQYFQYAIELAQQTQSFDTKIIVYQSLSYLMQKNGSTVEAINYLQKGLHLALIHKNSAIPQLLLEIGKLKLTTNRTQEAIDHFKSCITYARNQQNNRILTQALTILGQIHMQQGQYALSTQYFNEAIEKTNLLQSKMNIEEIARFEARYDLMQKEQEIELLDRERKLREVTLNNAKLKSKLYFFGIILLLALVIVLSYHIVSHIRKNRLLSYQNAKINEQNEELNQMNHQLSQSENKLMQALSTKNKLFSIIGHDLKSPLMDVKSLIFILKQSHNNARPIDIKAHAANIENRLITLLELLNNLLNWGMADRNLLVYAPENTNIVAIIQKAITIFDGQIQSKNIKINTVLPEKLIWNTDTNMFEFIVRNLISNAIKFSHEQSQIDIALNTHNQTMEFVIEDFGIGMNRHQKESIFFQTSEKIQRGTNNEKGSGLGLSLSNEFIRQMNGTINVESEPEKGTKITVLFNNNNQGFTTKPEQ